MQINLPLLEGWGGGGVDRWSLSKPKTHWSCILPKISFSIHKLSRKIWAINMFYHSQAMKYLWNPCGYLQRAHLHMVSFISDIPLISEQREAPVNIPDFYLSQNKLLSCCKLWMKKVSAWFLSMEPSWSVILTRWSLVTIVGNWTKIWIKGGRGGDSVACRCFYI